MIRNKYSVVETRPNGSLRIATINNKKSRTQQHHKDQVDANLIVKKYGGYHMMPDPKLGMYADLTKVSDYHTSLLEIQKAQAAFDALPSNLRTRFNNDPAQLLAFIQDPKNKAEGVTLGLFEPPKNTDSNPNPNDPNDPKPKSKTKNPNPEDPS